MPKRDSGEALVTAIKTAGLVPSVAYVPTDEQRQLKAKFWLALKATPHFDDDEISPAAVEHLVGRDITAWVKQPNFWLWFSTRDSVKENLEMAAEKAAEWAIMALDPLYPLNDNARVNLVKYVLEFAGRTPPTRREIKWADRDIEAMDEAQLDQMIEKLSTKKLKAKEG